MERHEIIASRGLRSAYRAATGGWLDHGKSIHLSVYAQTYSHLTDERGFS
jgi:hypothetical protein